jgi:flagellar biogenesis protein FliO
VNQIAGAIRLFPILLSLSLSLAQGAARPAGDTDANRPVTADIVSPSPAPRITASFDKVPIARAGPSADSAGPGSSTSSDSDSTMDVPRVVGALALVLILILLLRWIAFRFFSAAPVANGTRAVQVLSRSLVAPRQSVVLMRVGRRLLVVADNGSQLASLAQITDADEVAALVGQVQGEKLDSAARTFGSFIGRVRKEEEPESLPAEAADTEVESAVGGQEPSVSEARAELSGLMEQVRLVTRQFNRT